MRFSFRCLVEAVREMSTDVDETKAPDLIHVKTANRMSTGVDTKVAGVPKVLKLQAKCLLTHTNVDTNISVATCSNHSLFNTHANHRLGTKKEPQTAALLFYLYFLVSMPPSQAHT